MLTKRKSNAYYINMTTAETAGEISQELNLVTPTSPESARGSARWSLIRRLFGGAVGRSLEGAATGGALVAAALGVIMPIMIWKGLSIESWHSEMFLSVGLGTAFGALIGGFRRIPF